MNIDHLKRQVIFSVYPNARGYGFVYMENQRKIIDFGTVRLHPINNSRILERISKALKFFRPSVILTLDPEGKSSRVGKRVRKLIEDIEKLTANENLPIYKVSRDQIREVFFQFGATTKYEISRALITEFKELEQRLPEKRELWTAEHPNMAIFDALSLAIAWYYLND